MKINEEQMAKKLQEGAFFTDKHHNQPVVMITNKKVYKANGYSLKLSQDLEKSIKRN